MSQQHPSPSAFASLGVPADLVDAIASISRDITDPTPIQAATLPDSLAGRDVAGRAPTGSGKTLAFALPMAARLQRARPVRPRGLVLVPTRELAAQVAETLEPLLAARGLRVATVYGGVPYNRQLQAIRRGCDVVVACPGRLRDLLDRGALRLGDVELVVVDEADRMADMGFLPEVKRLLDQTSAERQTLLFSATLDGAVDVLVKRYQRNPTRHEPAIVEEDQGDVVHHFWRAERTVRIPVVANLVTKHGPSIVFCRTKHGADRVAKQLEREGVRAVAIHGGRSQSQRDRALEAFRLGRAQALVATDVAARGIHVDDVALVVHHDLPEDEKDFVHRSGRTGRAGRDGVVVSLVGGDQRKLAHKLREAVGSIAVLDDPPAAWIVGRAPSAVGSAAPQRPAQPASPGQARGARRGAQGSGGYAGGSQSGPRRSGGPGRSGSPGGAGRSSRGRRGRPAA